MMNFTQQQLESMSDLQLNIVVAGFFYDCDDLMISVGDNENVEVYCHGIKVDSDYKPCSSWKDCGNLIDECGIDLQHDQMGNGLHFAMDYNGDITSKHENPKRAVTIVYILIKQQ